MISRAACPSLIGSTLVALLLPLAGFAPAQQSSFSGGNDFGQLVAADESQIALAFNGGVRLSDSLNGGLQTSNVFAGTSYAGGVVHDIAVDGNVFLASVTAPGGLGQDVVLSTLSAGVWSVPTAISTTAVTARVAAHDGMLGIARSVGPDVRVLLYDTSPLSLVASALSVGQGMPLDIALGDGPAGELACLVSRELNGANTVFLELWDGVSSSLNFDFVFAGSSSEEYGAALAIDEVSAWIGAPGADFPFSDTGRVELWLHDGAGGLTISALVFGEQAGDRAGRAFDVLDGVMVFSLAGSTLAPATPNAGILRFLRRDPSSGSWVPQNDAFHSPNGPVDGSDFGASVALRNLVQEPGAVGSVLVGVPGQNFATSLPIYPAPMIESVGSGLAGTLPSPPALRLEGASLDGAPCRLSLSNVVPNNSAYLILGFAEVNAPLKGGVLVPDPFLIKKLPVGASGELDLFFEWVAQPGPSYSVSLQYWVQDPGGPAGFSATPGVRITEF